MKISYILILMLVFHLPLITFGQTDKTYEKNVYEFVNQIRQEGFFWNNPDTIITRTYFVNKNMFMGVSFVAFKARYPNFLTENEFQELSRQFHDDSSRFYLKENEIIRSRFISDSALNQLDSSQSYMAKYCSFWSLSKPCFLRNYTICVISYGRCDSQSTRIYKKENNKWVYFAEMGRISGDH